MKSAAISELKASLSEYLDRVKRGEEVIVTDRDRPVARLIPFRSEGGGEGERERMVREGILEPGKSGRVPKQFLNPSSIKDPSGALLKILLEEREEQT